jgi:hypothetical protein
MLLRPLLTLSLLSGLLPLVNHAQTTSDSPRFYVGLSGNQLSNIPFNENGITPRLIGPALMAGLQLTPRLAVQTGLSYHWQKDTYATYQFIPTPGNANTITATTRSKYFLVPALLRYTATALVARAHFDMVGGATLVHATGSLTYEGNGGTIDPALRNRSFSDTRFNLTLGPAVRAALSSRLELTAAGLVSMVVGEDYYRFSDRFFLNTSIGVNYTFGQL